jgi:hypothetical protein
MASALVVQTGAGGSTGPARPLATAAVPPVSKPVAQVATATAATTDARADDSLMHTPKESPDHLSERPALQACPSGLGPCTGVALVT